MDRPLKLTARLPVGTSACPLLGNLPVGGQNDGGGIEDGASIFSPNTDEFVGLVCSDSFAVRRRRSIDLPDARSERSKLLGGHLEKVVARGDWTVRRDEKERRCMREVGDVAPTMDDRDGPAWRFPDA